MPMSRDTIFALATPYAKSGVAIIRISGPRARQALIHLTGKNDWQPNMALPARFRNIDNGLALFFRAPKSFTGEDVVELQAHGSLAVIRELLEILGAMEGLRHAEPGEFTRRAFLNGKMDLLEAEGLADLIDAETPLQRVQALSQMRGSSSRYYEDLRAQAVQTLALLEAYIDFPDEEIPLSVLQDVEKNIAALKNTIEATLKDNHRGERMREGIRIAILGAPNVGKSSLLNMLAGREAAIVSHQAGTTRDVVEVHMNIAGFSVILADTAGLRETSDDIEEEGVRRAVRQGQDADFKLVLFDATQLAAPDAATLSQVDEKSIIIANKCDLLPQKNNNNRLLNNNIFYISTKNGDGVSNLLKNIENKISSQFSSALAPVITRARHRGLLAESLQSLDRFAADKPIELACEELRSAAGAIGRITGKIAVDEVLDVVFKQFCIGK